MQQMRKTRTKEKGESMTEIGRICIKIAGRDAGKKCVIIDKTEKGFVIIAGETRKRKCNIKHLEPTNKKIDIKKGATKEEVKEALKKIGITLKETKPKTKKEKPTKKKKIKKKTEQKK